MGVFGTIHISPLTKGTVITVELTIVAVVFGMILGLFLALGRLSKNVVLNKI